MSEQHETTSSGTSVVTTASTTEVPQATEKDESQSTTTIDSSGTKKRDRSMLSKLLKEHQTRQFLLREENARRSKSAVVSVGAVTRGLVDSVNGGVSQVFNNQRKLENELRTLHQQTRRFAKQTTQWLQVVDNFTTSLKELGDVETWSKTIEHDMKAIAASLEVVAKAVDKPPADTIIPTTAPVASATTTTTTTTSSVSTPTTSSATNAEQNISK